MMRISAMGSITALVLLGSGLGATAAPLVYTYTGTVSSGSSDDAGLFGKLGFISAGTSFTAVETFELPAPASNDDAFYTNYYGGAGYGLPTFGSVSLTIGTTSLKFDGTSSGLIQLAKFDIGSLTTQVQSLSDDVISFTIPSNYVPMSPTVIALDPASSGGFGYNPIDGASTDIAFSPTQLTVTTGSPGMSPVPLPASAPMFGAALIALGAVGYGMKRKTA